MITQNLILIGLYALFKFLQRVLVIAYTIEGGEVVLIFLIISYAIYLCVLPNWGIN